jgi:nucleoside-diphosphate-sugar epimerase
MKVLVTGATGLIGHRVAQLLVTAGHHVRALVRDPARARELFAKHGLADAEVVAGDITNRASVEAAVADRQWVFHAAGMPEQWHKDEAIFDRVNRGGTVNVLEAAHAAGVERAIYTSTMDVFAAPPGGTLSEATIDREDKPTAYERSKQAADRQAQRIHEAGLDLVHLCPAAVYGPSPVNVGLNSFFIKLMNKQSPLLPPGGMSLLYIDGCARAHLAAAEVGRSGERYLLADGHASNEELAREILAQSDLRKVPPTAPGWLLKGVAKGGQRLAKLVDVQPLIAEGQLAFLQWNVKVDASKARRELGFKPTPLADGVALTIAHLRKEKLVP